MYERIMAEKNKILEIKSGSHLYGLSTPLSDEDYLGIFIPDIEYVFGFKKCEEVDLSFKDKLENGKNSKDAIDRKMYNFNKYIKLALDNNPGIIETLFVTNENIVFINEVGRTLLKYRNDFLHKGLIDRFCGYAIGQKKKMILKKDTFEDMENACMLLEKFDNGLLLPFCEEYSDFKKLFKYTNKTDEHYRVGDMCIVKNQTVKRAKFEIEKRIGDKTNRKELIRKYGFDCKFGSHLIRLLLEGKELLDTENLIFPLKNKEVLLDIKNGKWNLDEVLSYSNQLENEIKISVINTKLPIIPNVNKIERYVIETFKDFYKI